LENEPDVPDVLATGPALGPHLIVGVDPDKGLTEAHVERARGWLEQLR
jgi:hypothetical protein